MSRSQISWVTQTSEYLTLNWLGALAIALADRIEAAASSAAFVPESSASALVSITNHPGVSIDTLRRALNLTHSGAVRLVDTLEAKGMVERRRSDHDARAVALWPTKAGHLRAHSVLASRRKLLEPVLASLSPKQRRELKAALQKALRAITETSQSARAICRYCDEGVCRSSGCPVERAASERDKI